MKHKLHTYLLCIFLASMHSLVWAANIKDIRIGVKKTFTRVVFDLDKKPNIYNVKYMTSPERIILDFTEGKINQRAIKSTAAYPLINNINGTNIRNNGFSVEVELQQPANFKHFLLQPTKKSGYRLVLDITPGEHKFETTPVEGDYYFQYAFGVGCNLFCYVGNVWDGVNYTEPYYISGI